MDEVDEIPDESSDKPRIRFDPAHKTASAPVELPEFVPALAELEVDASEQLQVQAVQLARHLQERRREVDQREAHLNARIAELENELRASRLWLRERSDEFERREADLSERLAEQDSQIRNLSASESALDDDRDEQYKQFAAREEQLRLREEQVAEGQCRLATEADSLLMVREELQNREENIREALQSFQQREAEIRVAEQSVLKRQHYLDGQKRTFDEQWRMLQSERDQWQQRVHENQEQLRQERSVCQQQRRQFEEQRAQQLKTLSSRQERLDQQQAVVQRIRDDILRLHREALEMRLIAEQLWSQMTGRVAPSALTEGLSRIRAQLADEFRLAHQSLSTQRAELESLVTKLDEKRRALSSQRDELMGWLTRRQQELAEQSGQLTQREQQLLEEKQSLESREEHWQRDRRDLQRQIRKLSLQVRPLEFAAA